MGVHRPRGGQGEAAPAPALFWLSLIAPLATLGGNLAGVYAHRSGAFLPDGAPMWVGTLTSVAVLGGGTLVWVVFPLLEVLRWEGRKTAPLPDRRAFDALLSIHVVVQLANVASLAALASLEVPPLLLAGAVFSTGSTTGTSAFIVAHELMHRPTVRERLGSWLLLGTAFNTHFHVEHVHVHHRKVGTSEDPASARATDNPFVFVVRASVGQLVHAWQVALRKYPEQRGGPRTPYLVALALALALNLLALALVALLSPIAALAVVAQAALATFMMNLVNYVEHWGLRRELSEPVRPAHSWDTRSVVTRYTLFDLGMHADHHFRASKPYWTLEEHDDAPEMPVGLYAATLLTLVPPLFRRVFAPALAAHRARAVTG